MTCCRPVIIGGGAPGRGKNEDGCAVMCWPKQHKLEVSHMIQKLSSYHLSTSVTVPAMENVRPCATATLTRASVEVVVRPFSHQ